MIQRHVHQYLVLDRTEKAEVIRSIDDQQNSSQEVEDKGLYLDQIVSAVLVTLL